MSTVIAPATTRPSSQPMSRAVPPAGMPAALVAGDVGLSFIQPCFSKTGSSPTKVAEYLACGLPVVVNAGIGDQGALAAEAPACTVMPDLSDAAVDEADSLLVVGSGAIGIEFASFYRNMGAEVTVVEVLDRVLPVEDEEISAFAKK